MILPDILEEYLSEQSSPEPDLLQDLRRETFQKTIQPYMISGEYQGRLLALLSRLLRPKSVLELGTFTGYATLCLAEGLAKDGTLITIDKNPELEFISQRYFKASPYANQIDYRNATVADFLNQSDGSFDLVFLDADKENYLSYYPKIKQLLNKGGLLIADNVLWYGKVLEPVHPEDKATQSIVTFNKQLATDTDFLQVMLPVRDGLTLAFKR